MINRKLIYADEALHMINNSKQDNPFAGTTIGAVWEQAHDCAISCVEAARGVSDINQAKWLFWAGWMSNHDMRIDDARCSKCNYRHHTVRREPGSRETEQDVLDKLSHFCPRCRAEMSVGN